MTKTIQLYVIASLMLLVAVSGLHSCVKEKADKNNLPAIVQYIDINRIRNCHLEGNRYPSQINANIEGTWVWVSNACYWTGKETYSADKHVVVTFNDGSLYKIFEDGRLIAEGTWTLSQSGDDSWSFITSGTTTYLHGNVWLCNNEIVFNSSYIDGCDYYFVKK